MTDVLGREEGGLGFRNWLYVSIYYRPKSTNLNVREDLPGLVNGFLNLLIQLSDLYSFLTISASVG